MNHGHGPLSELKRYSLAQLYKFGKAAQRRDALIQAVTIKNIRLATNGEQEDVQAEVTSLLTGIPRVEKDNGRKRRKQNRS